MNRHWISRGPVRVATETNPHGKGWLLRLRFGRGWGYRYIDFPWHSPNVAAPWWRRRAWVAYVPGYTLIIGRSMRHIYKRTHHAFIITTGKTAFCPEWW